MIPGNGQWNTLEDPEPYLTIPVEPPPPIAAGIQAVSLGPFAINDSRNRLDARYWVVSQTGNNVIIQFSRR